ncbi:acyl-CoA dehydrogenase [Pseudomonas sp. RW409]|uniref:acyl-CoA dehydrogenase n=1 Tax=Pseudomonas sp. RW409 TaxID=2202895 RepID=UPI000D736853|nr:acyl-CoA dehydrogenase [Pseudomonas sp. RW409]PWY36412.1 acyl-CoA dehydrogenase [Pseudomonas sp. RW409]
MSGNLTPTEMLCYHLSQKQDEGIMLDEYASMTKVYVQHPMQETEGWAREVLSANGALFDYNIGRFAPMPKRSKSYEGTRNEFANRGQAITGFSALVHAALEKELARTRGIFTCRH